MLTKIPSELVDSLHAMNPWWKSQPGKPLPSFRRWPFKRAREMLRSGIAPVTVLPGPRQVGKTTLLLQLIANLLAEGREGRRILRVQFDELPTLGGLQEPILAISRWFEEQVLGSTFNEAAHGKEPAYLFFDEVQDIATWAPQVKSLVDIHAVRVFMTGSSALRIESGRDSLAGRISTLEMGPLLLREIAELRFGDRVDPFWVDNGLDMLATRDFWLEGTARSRREAMARDRAFTAFSDRGGYPFAQQEPATAWHRLSDYLNETVVRRVIQHDLRGAANGRGPDEGVLAEVFRLACRYAGQAPGRDVLVPELQRALGRAISWDRARNYLSYLDQALLVRLVPALELRLRRQSSPPKLCLCDHAPRAARLQEVVPIDRPGLDANPHLFDLAGHIAESIVGQFFVSVPGVEVAHLPVRGPDPEVDFVVTVGTRRIPVEVKYRKRVDSGEDTRGLRAFLEKTVHNAPFGLLVTVDDEVVVNDPRIIPLSLSSLLWFR
ncbi:MAG: ATP-binding protein [Planctomycetes bacterium]|nr:ATP-binding protein [Planctomycetota bacterium]